MSQRLTGKQLSTGIPLLFSFQILMGKSCLHKRVLVSVVPGDEDIRVFEETDNMVRAL